VFDFNAADGAAMLRAMIGRLLAAALFFGFAAFATPVHAQTMHRAQAVVELYTSQGCSQCPRANRLLGMFARDEGVLALTFAVPIWDYLGWRDTFAEQDFEDRQRAYSRALNVRGRYTPQLVIDGGSAMSASYWDEARAALDEAKATPLSTSPSISVTTLRYTRVRVAIGAGPHRSAPADVWVVAYDRGPVTEYVTAGININRRVYHYNLVRSMYRVGHWDGSAVYYEYSRCSPECAVIIQEPNGGRVLAAAYTSLRGG
jgi:hypothetical protein